jgi:hypothetical protein
MTKHKDKSQFAPFSHNAKYNRPDNLIPVNPALAKALKQVDKQIDLMYNLHKDVDYNLRSIEEWLV